MDRVIANSFEEQRRYLPRNFWLGVVSGIAYNLYCSVLGTELVMSWFLSELTGSNLLISLLLPIDLGSWYFLQILLSGYVQRQPRSLPFYRVMGVVRVTALALLAALTFLLEDPGRLLAAFLILFTVNSVAAGLAGLPFLNVVAKSVRPTRRGMFFGWRRFAGGLLGLFGGVLVKVILGPNSGLDFPDNYAVLFLAGSLFMTVVVGAFGLIAEPTEGVRGESRPAGLAEQLRRGAMLPAHDRAYARYLVVRLATAAAGYASPFYAVYARRSLAAPPEMVGIYLMGFTLSGVLSNLVSGKIGDRYGNRRLMRLAAATAVLSPALALLVAHLPEEAVPKASLVFALVFAFRGLHVTASSIGGSNYVLELASSEERPTYVGFANGLTGLALFLSPLGGAVVDRLGFTPLFLLSLTCGLVAVLFSLGLREPREGRVTVS